MSGARLNPTLFDKLVADVEISGLSSSDPSPGAMSETMRYYPVPQLNRFGEAALRMTIRRDLAWLLNTTRFDALGGLDDYPEVHTSVLNFGVPDLAGRSLQGRTLLDRAREIRNALRTYEPRLDRDTLVVEPVASEEYNSVAFLIHGDISSGPRPIAVHFRTELEADNAAVAVSE